MNDWAVLGLAADPAPGDPQATAALAGRLRQEAHQTSANGATLASVATRTGDLRMAGDYAPKYRDALAELPVQMGKLAHAYSGCGDALATFAGRLAEAKTRAGTALRQGEDADARYQAAMRELRATLPADRAVVMSSGLGLNEIAVSAATIGLDPATTAQVRAAVGRARTADADREAARRLADQAAGLREDAETRCVEAINDALDGSGIKDKPWWQKAWDAVTAPFRSWDSFVDLCRKVALVAGAVALFISGPIGLALVAIALVASAVLFAHTLQLYSQGKAGLLDVGMDALGLIPGGAGAASLGRLSRGAIALARDLPEIGGTAAGALRGLREVVPALRGTIGDLRSSAIPFLRRVVQRDPIDVATGEMVLQQVDLELPGTLPLVLSRTHASSYRAGRWFGRSWASTLDQRLEVDGGGAFYAGEDGVLLAFPLPAAGAAVEPEEGPRWRLARDGLRFRLTEPVGGRTLHFAPVPGSDAGVLLLVALEDRNGNRIDVSYDARGIVTGLRHSGGYAIAVDTEAGLVTGLRLLGADRGADRQVVRYSYDGSGRLTGVLNSSGQPLRFDYDAAGRIVAWHDRNGTSYRYTYDGRGRCVATAGSAGCLDGTLRYDEHDEESRTTTVTDSQGHATTYELNGDLQVVRQTDPLGHVTASEWDRYDRLLSRTDPLRRVTRYDYDEDGNLTRVTRPDGSTVGLGHNALRMPQLITGPDDATWERVYDERGNLVCLTDPCGAVTLFGYDERGALAWVEDAAGGRTRIENDGAGLPVAVTHPDGATVRCTRDMFGRVAAVTDAAGATTFYTWTVEGRPASRTLPSGLTERWTYDAEGNMVEHVDVEGHLTRTDYTHFDLPAVRITPDGARVVFSYDTELRLVAVTNPAGSVWRYEYDEAGRLVGEVDFGGRRLRYRLDSAGQPFETVNGADETVSYTRDVLGRPVRRVAGGVVTAFEYDATGRVTRAVNPAADVQLEYDPLGRVVAETCNGRRLTSSYDAAGRRVSRITPSGAASTWEFTVRGLVAALSTVGRRLEFRYDAAGREVERRLGDGVRLLQSWDGDGRLRSQCLTTPRRDLLERRYTYRRDGYLTAVHDSLDGLRTLELDPLGRVTAVSASAWTERYAYDAGGSPLSASWPDSAAGAAAVTGRREYDGTQVQRAGATSYQYDAQGRMTSRTVRTLSGQRRTWIYGWDAEDRLVGVRMPDGVCWRYDYDPFGRRIAKRRMLDDGTVAERVDYVWDGLLLAEQIRSGPDEVRVTTWDWEPGSVRPVGQSHRIPLQRYGPDTVGEAPQEWIDEQFHAIVADLVGTPTELVDADGRLAWRSRSSVWGAPAPDGADREPSDVDCPLRFPGQYSDAETGLHYNVFRYYDPRTGRYLSPDPIGLTGGPDPYAYVPNALQWADPLGLSPYPAAAAADSVEGAARLVYRGGSRTADNLTPRPGVDSTGLSTFDSPSAGGFKPGSKVQVIDADKLKLLTATPDAPPPGHVSLAPPDLSQLEEWAATRGSGQVHPYTQDVLDAIVDEIRIPR